MNKQNVSAFLKKMGLYKPLRKIYNVVARYKKQTEVSVNGHQIKFWTPTFYLNDYLKNSIGEEQFLKEILSRLNSQNIFWDVGANIGFYSIIAGKEMNVGSKVIAFEPEPETYDLLNKNIPSFFFTFPIIFWIRS